MELFSDFMKFTSNRGKEDIIRRACEDFSIEAGFLIVIHMKDGESLEVILPREVV